MKKKQKKQTVENIPVYKREQHKRANSEIAEEVRRGLYGEDWKYAVRKLGYNTRAIEVLLKWK